MLPPGTHLEFFTWNGNIKLNILESRTTADAWQFSSYWQNGGKDAVGYHPAMAAHGSYVAGKFVWFSFTPDAMQPHKDNNAIMEKLAMNAINWLAGRPLVDFAIWPPGYSAGGSIAVVGKGSETAVGQLRKSVEALGKPLDLIVDPDNIPDYLQLTGSAWGDLVLGSNDTALFNSLNPRDIFDWLESSCLRLENIAGRRPVGLFPPDWNYGEFAAVGAATEGMRFVLCSPNPRFYGPTESLLRPHGWWIFSKKVQMATLPKCQVSADEWIDYAGIKGAPAIYSAISNGMQVIRKMGGMYVAILDPDALESQNALQLPVRIAAGMDSLGFWTASIGEVMDRFSGWRGMRATTMEVTPTRLQIQISNESDVDLQGVKVDVYYSPDVISSIEVTSQVMGLKSSNIAWNKKSGLLSFTLSEVTASMNATVSLDASINETNSENKE